MRTCWVIPPGHHAEFVAGLADVLEVYRCPDDPPRPVIGLDEQPTPLSGATRTPLPVQPGPAQRYDSAYARSGTANHFIIVAPVAGWRQVSPSLAESTAPPPPNPGFPQQWRERFKPGQILSGGRSRVVP